tara:strand:- start:33 stop:812 length:780 start_codon:yes stop_codon:yes gene_type:complete
MIKGKYHLAKVRPNIDVTGATAYSAHDVLFDWHRFEIPRGACAIKSFNMIVAGTEGAAAAGLDMEIFFATSVNGAAPTTIAAANVDSRVKATWTACRNNIIGHKILDASAMENSDTYTLSYNVWDQTAVGDQVQNQIDIVLEGDPSYPGATAGYQSIWIAAVAIEGGEDFGTGVILNETDAATLAAGGTALLDVDGVDPRLVFAPGDELIAADGALIGIVKSVDSDVLITLEAAHTAALANDDEICFRGPIQFNFGLEY